MKRIIYRTFKEGDEKLLADLFNRSFQMNGASFIRTPRSWNWRYVQSPSFEPEMIQIAEDIKLKKIVGAICVNLVENININGKKFLKGEINDVSCLPEYTKKGIAKNLMKRAMCYLLEKKCDISMLSADFHGFPRKKIYLKHGFVDIDRELVFVWFSNVVRLITDLPAFLLISPLLLIISYLPRLFFWLFLKKNPLFNDFRYEIVRNEKHIQYMKVLNNIMSQYYEGFYPYNKEKYLWARIKVATKKDQPTYIMIRKDDSIIGGAEFSCIDIHSFKFKLKFKIGIVHEIFIDKNIFSSKKEIIDGYSYLIDKLIKAAAKRPVGALILFNSSFEDELFYALKKMNLITFKGASIMINKLKKHTRIEKLKKPLYIPTHISLSLP